MISKKKVVNIFINDVSSSNYNNSHPRGYGFKNLRAQRQFLYENRKLSFKLQTPSKWLRIPKESEPLRPPKFTSL